jgi:hypothetical protein
MGSRCRRAVADAGHSRHGSGNGPAPGAEHAPRNRLHHDRPGLHLRHPHRTGDSPPTILVAGGRPRDRPQSGGIGRSYSGRSPSFRHFSSASTPRRIVTSGPKSKPALNALPPPSATGSRPPRPTNPTAGTPLAPDRPAAAGSGSCGPAAVRIRGICARAISSSRLLNVVPVRGDHPLLCP